MYRTHLRAAAFCLCMGSPLSAFAQTAALSEPSEAPRVWIDAAAANEIHIINEEGNFPLRYRMRKVDARNDITRDMIESRDGTVARLVQRNGKPLTPAEDAAEVARLNSLLHSPKEFFRHQERSVSARNYSIQIVHEIPKAFIFEYAPGQPQTPSTTGPQVVIDFRPDPAYHSPSMVTNPLTGVAGRLWIDRTTRHVVRIQGRVTRPVDVGWGVVARVYPGGTVEFEQTRAGGDRWAYSHLHQDLTIREMMVKTAHQHATMDAGNFELLPAPLSYQDAIHLLLATPSSPAGDGR